MLRRDDIIRPKMRIFPAILQKLEIEKRKIVHQLINGTLNLAAQHGVFPDETTLLQFTQRTYESLIIKQFRLIKNFFACHAGLFLSKRRNYRNIRCRELEKRLVQRIKLVGQFCIIGKKQSVNVLRKTLPSFQMRPIERHTTQNHIGFSQILALIAFTGYGSSPRSTFASSPEFTTNGMLPKCWRRENGSIRLYKGGTTGASHTGFEPYSEYYCAQVARALGINAIAYGLSKWKGVLCSTCELFTGKAYSFLPVGRIVTSGGMRAVKSYYEALGEPFTKALGEMLVLDALICNTDRHFGNFGFLVDNKTNQIAAPAPLFDHGNALFNFAGVDDLKDDAALTRYANSLDPSVYDDFIGEIELTHEQRNNLRKLLDFRFKRHSRYNLDGKRLAMLEKVTSNRAAEIRDGLRKMINLTFQKHARYNLPPKRLKMIEHQIQTRAREILGY